MKTYSTIFQCSLWWVKSQTCVSVCLFVSSGLKLYVNKTDLEPTILWPHVPGLQMWTPMPCLRFSFFTFSIFSIFSPVKCVISDSCMYSYSAWLYFYYTYLFGVSRVRSEESILSYCVGSGDQTLASRLGTGPFTCCGISLTLHKCIFRTAGYSVCLPSHLN